eukprot:5245935-Amphidinium_carterae.1
MSLFGNASTYVFPAQSLRRHPAMQCSQHMCIGILCYCEAEVASVDMVDAMQQLWDGGDFLLYDEAEQRL